MRIVIDNGVLTINGQVQPECVFQQYKDCVEGKALVIMSSGKVIQVTER